MIYSETTAAIFVIFIYLISQFFNQTTILLPPFSPLGFHKPRHIYQMIPVNFKQTTKIFKTYNNYLLIYFIYILLLVSNTIKMGQVYKNATCECCTSRFSITSPG